MQAAAAARVLVVKQCKAAEEVGGSGACGGVLTRGWLPMQQAHALLVRACTHDLYARAAPHCKPGAIAECSHLPCFGAEGEVSAREVLPAKP